MFLFRQVGTWYKQSDIVTFMEETKRSLSWNGNWYQEVQCRYKGKDHSKFKRKKKKVTVTTILVSMNLNHLCMSVVLTVSQLSTGLKYFGVFCLISQIEKRYVFVFA